MSSVALLVLNVLALSVEPSLLDCLASLKVGFVRKCLMSLLALPCNANGAQ